MLSNAIRKPVPSSSVGDTLSRVLAEQHDLLLATENILERLAALFVDGHQLKNAIESDEQILFDRLNWDWLKVQQEVSRMQDVLRNRPTARKNLGAAETALKNATEKRDGRLDSLQAEIDKLIAERNTLHDAVKSAAAELSSIVAARSRLRERAPLHVRMLTDKWEARLTATTGKNLRDAESRIKQIRALLDIPYQSGGNTNIVHYCEQLPRDHVAYPTETLSGRPEDNMRASTKTVSESQWAAVHAELREELKTLEPRAAEIKVEYDRAKSEIDKSRDFYLTDVR